MAKTDSSADSTATGTTLRNDLKEMLAEYRETAQSAADLIAAELQLAATTAVWLLALGISLALLLTTAWLTGMLAIAAVITDTPDWPFALMLVSGANLIAAYAIWFWMQATVPNLTFRELRALLGQPRSKPHDKQNQVSACPR